MPQEIAQNLWAHYGLLGLGWLIAAFLYYTLRQEVAECHSKYLELSDKYYQAQQENIRILTLLSERIKP